MMSNPLFVKWLVCQEMSSRIHYSFFSIFSQDKSRESSVSSRGSISSKAGKEKAAAAAGLSPRIMKRLQVVKSGISFVNNLKLGE